MKKLIAKKDFTLNGVPYVKGFEVEVNDISTIKRLNEKGFIEPLNFKELTIIEKELKNNDKKINEVKEEE